MEIKPIEPTPKQAAFITSDAKFSCFNGGYGSGKTFAGCLRALLLSQYPGNYGLIGRSTYPELRDTTRRAFFEICPPEYYDESLGGQWRPSENLLKLTNGSEIIFRHLDTVSEAELKSLNLGWFYIDQAEEIGERVFQVLQSRLRLGNVPNRYGFITCNPSPGSWIYEKWKKPLEEGNPDPDYHLVEATSYENPYLPPDYIPSLLKDYPEDMVKKYIEGRWDAYEDTVYPEFDRDIHVIKPFEIPKGWEKIVSLDHGMVNPTCCLWGAIDFDGNIIIYDEYYQPGIVSEHAKEIIRKSEGQEISLWLIDPATTAKTTQKNDMMWSVMEEYEDNNLYFVPANNEKLAGVNRVKEFLKKRTDRRHIQTRETPAPRLYITKNCVNTLWEFPKYQWRKFRSLTPRNAPEQTRDLDDHCFVGDTSILTMSEDKQVVGAKPIKFIKKGEYVWSPFGWNKVYRAGSTGIKKVRDYGIFKCTPDHKILTNNGLVEVDKLGYSDKILAWSNVRKWSLTELLIGGIQTPKIALIGFIFKGLLIKSLMARQDFYTEINGNTIKAKSLMVIWFIILMVTLSIMTLLILSLSVLANMLSVIIGAYGKVVKNTSIKSVLLLKFGTLLKKVGLITPEMPNRHGQYISMLPKHVQSAIRGISLPSLIEASIAVVSAKQQPLEDAEVFNLSTHFGMYFANGILVCNSMDALRMLIMSRFPAPLRKPTGYEMIMPEHRKLMNDISKPLPKNLVGDEELGYFEGNLMDNQLAQSDYGTGE